MSFNSLLRDPAIKGWWRMDNSGVTNAIRNEVQPNLSGITDGLTQEGLAFLTGGYQTNSPGRGYKGSFQLYLSGYQGIDTQLPDNTFSTQNDGVTWACWSNPFWYYNFSPEAQYARIVSFDGKALNGIESWNGRHNLGQYVNGVGRSHLSSATPPHQDSGVWRHRAWTFNYNTQVCKGYSDGISVGTGQFITDPEWPSSDSNTTRIGCYFNGGMNNTYGGFMAGHIGFTRVLSASEVSEIYYGPEPTYSGGASLTVTTGFCSGACGSWDAQYNGPTTFEWQIRENNTIAVEGTGSGIYSAGNFTPESSLYSLHVRCSNSGGYDETKGDAGYQDIYRVPIREEIKEGRIFYTPLNETDSSTIVNNHNYHNGINQDETNEVARTRLSEFLDGELEGYGYGFNNTQVAIPGGNLLRNVDKTAGSVWIYPTDYPSSFGYIFYVRGGGAGNAREVLIWTFNDGNCRIGGRGSDGSSFASTGFPNSEIVLNQWTHLAYNIDRSNQYAEIYVSGELYHTGAVAFDGPTSDTDSLGANIGKNGTYDFVGGIADLAVYDRNLTKNEIQSLYRRGLSNNIESGLICHYKMDDNQANGVIQDYAAADALNGLCEFTGGGSSFSFGEYPNGTSSYSINIVDAGLNNQQITPNNTLSLYQENDSDSTERLGFSIGGLAGNDQNYVAHYRARNMGSAGVARLGTVSSFSLGLASGSYNLSTIPSGHWIEYKERIDNSNTTFYMQVNTDNFGDIARAEIDYVRLYPAASMSGTASHTEDFYVGDGNGPGGSLKNCGINFDESYYINTKIAGPTGYSPLSVSTWFKTEDATGDTTNYLVSWGDNGNAEAFRLSIEDGVIWERSVGGRIMSWGNTNDFNDGQWHHIVLKKPQSPLLSSFSCYVDGRQIPSGYIGTDEINIDSTYRIRIGEDYGGTKYLGDVADLRVYNREISEVEIQELYKLGQDKGSKYPRWKH